MTIIWTPSRNLSAVRDFIKALHELAIDVSWADFPEDANLWVIDGSVFASDPEYVRRYAAHKKPPRVAYLAHRFSDLPHAAWTFFKMPFANPQLIRQWLASPSGSMPALREAALDAEHAESPADHPWRRGTLRLKRWPNMARYGHEGRDVYLIAACLQLLKSPTSYRSLLDIGARPELLDRLLDDAWASKMLEIRAVSPARRRDAAAAAASPPRAAARADANVGLFRRLLARISPR